MSMDPPAPLPTTTRTGLTGKLAALCDQAGDEINANERRLPLPAACNDVLRGAM